MKKIIATILIMLFATNMSALANGVLTIDKDGNIKYEEGLTINSKLIEPKNSTTTSEQIKNNENSVTQKSNKTKLSGKSKLQEPIANNDSLASQATQQQEVKINVKDIDENYGKNDETLLRYHEKFQKYENQDDFSYLKKDIMSELKGYKKYNYPEIDDYDKNDPKILRFELQDGDYAILDTTVKSNRKYKYAAEYHKDGSLFGIVQIKTIRKTLKSATIQFNEYRDNDNEYIIKHIMFIDIEKKKDKVNIAQFVYKGSLYLSRLVCAQINNDLYLNKESKNLIVKMQKFDIPQEPLFNQGVKKNIYNTFGFLGMSLAICFVLALGPYGWMWLWVAISVNA